MRRVVLGVAAAALVFTIGCGDETETDGVDPASQPDAAAAVEGSPGYAATSEPPEEVPLTITMPSKRTDDDKKNDRGNDFIGRVVFPDFPRAPSQSPDTFSRGDVRTQYLVGRVPVDDDGRFSLVIEHFKGASTNSETNTLSFSAEAYCAPADPQEDVELQGTITRIACAADAPGARGDDKAKPPFRMVCSAIYDYLGDPPKTCEGTYACVKCPGGVRVCSENPQCVN